MATIISTSPSLCSPVGYEMVFLASASENITVGDLVTISSTKPSTSAHDCVVARATGSDAHGIAIKTVGKGGTAEICYRGEFDGYSGLTPGNLLSIDSGKLDSTAPATPTEPGTGAASGVIRATSPTRIRFRFA